MLLQKPNLVNTFKVSALILSAIIACLYFLPVTSPQRVEVPAGEAAPAGSEAASIDREPSGYRVEPAPAVAPDIDDSLPPAQGASGSPGASTAPPQSSDWLKILYPELSRISELEQEPAAVALAGLVPLLASEDPAIRLAAVESVGDMTFAAVLPVLSMALHDPDPRVRVTALQALAERDDESVTENIVFCLYDRDPEVRLAAIDALAALEAKTSVYALASLLSDPELSIRRRAVDALGDIGGESAVMYLRQARYDTDETIRSYADAILSEPNYAANR